MIDLSKKMNHCFSARCPVSKTGVLLLTLALVLTSISFTKGIQILMFIPAFVLAIFLYSFFDLYFKSRNIQVSNYNNGTETSLHIQVQKPYKHLFFELAFDNGKKIHFLQPNQSFVIPKVKEEKGDYLFIIQGKLDVVRKVILLNNISSESVNKEDEVREKEEDFYFHIRQYQEGDDSIRIDAMQSAKRGALYIRETLEEKGECGTPLKKDKENIMLNSNKQLAFRSGIKNSEYLEYFIILLGILGVHLEWQQWGFTIFSSLSLLILIIFRYWGKNRCHSPIESRTGSEHSEGSSHKAAEIPYAISYNRGLKSKILMNLAIFLPFAYFFYECSVSDDWVLAGAHFLILSSIIKHFFPRLRRDAFTYVFLILFVFVGLSLFSLKAWFIILFFAFLISSLLIFSICEGGDLRQEYSCYFGLQKTRGSTLKSVLGISLITILLFFLLPHGNREKQEMANYSIKESAVHTTGFDDEVTLDNIQKLKLDYSKQFVLENAYKNQIDNYKNLYWRGMRFSHFQDDAWQKVPKKSITLNQTNSSLSVLDREKEVWNIKYYLNGGRNIFIPKTPLEIQAKNIQLNPYDNSLAHFLRPQFEAQKVGLVFDKKNPVENRIQDIQVAVDENIENLFSEYWSIIPSNIQKDPLLLSAFVQSGFEYSLEAPAKSLQSFLYEEKQGHCEYYATVLALTLQHFGYKATLVNGFHGGEWNESASAWILRGADAHSWVEVLNDDAQWEIYDPTPALSTPFWFEENSVLKKFIYYYDILDIKWYEYIASFDADKQKRMWSYIIDKRHEIFTTVLIIIVISLAYHFGYRRIKKDFSLSEKEKFLLWLQKKFKNDGFFLKGLEVADKNLVEQTREALFKSAGNKKTFSQLKKKWRKLYT